MSIAVAYVAMETPRHSSLRVPLSEVKNEDGWIFFPHRSLGLDRHIYVCLHAYTQRCIGDGSTDTEQ